MDPDAFETVAIAYRQPEAAVIMSLLHCYEIPAYAMNAEAVRANPGWTLALGGVQIRVHRDWTEEAREILGDVAMQQAEPRRISVPERIFRVPLLLLGFMMGVIPHPRLGAVLLERQSTLRP